MTAIPSGNIKVTGVSQCKGRLYIWVLYKSSSVWMGNLLSITEGVHFLNAHSMLLSSFAAYVVSGAHFRNARQCGPC